MDMIKVVAARSKLGDLLSGQNITAEMGAILRVAHDALLAYERSDPKAQRQAFEAVAGPRDHWEIPATAMGGF